MKMLIDDAILLGISFENYSEAGIKKAFRLKVMTAHPDVGGTAEEFMAVENAQNNLLSAIKENISASQVFNDAPYKFTEVKKPKPKDNLEGITSLDLCLLISHISMLYYGDTLELMARDGKLFRYTPKDFKSGVVVPFLKDYIAWSCGTKSGLIEVLQPFEFSYSPKIMVSVILENLDVGIHQFIMMFGGRAFPYTFQKLNPTKGVVSTDVEFPISFRYVNGERRDIMLTIALDLYF